MTDYYLGDIIMTPYSYAPKYFAFCYGQKLAIAGNQPLFALIGTLYGGNGRTTFGLPDMRGRMPFGYSADDPGQPIGFAGGTEHVRLTEANLPKHNHTAPGNFIVSQLATTEDADLALPSEGSYPGTLTNTVSTGVRLYNPANIATNITLKLLQFDTDASVPVTEEGRGELVSNMQPYLGMQFCICVDGHFPTRPD